MDRGQSLPVRPTPNTNANKIPTKNNFMCSGICACDAFNCFIALKTSRQFAFNAGLGKHIGEHSTSHIPPVAFHFHTNDAGKTHRNGIPFVAFYDFPHTRSLHTVFVVYMRLSLCGVHHRAGSQHSRPNHLKWSRYEIILFLSSAENKTKVFQQRWR